MRVYDLHTGELLLLLKARPVPLRAASACLLPPDTSRQQPTPRDRTPSDTPRHCPTSPDPTAQAHFGEVLCAVGATGDQKVFSGGDDCAVVCWTPPACGLTAPAPTEHCRPRAQAERLGAPWEAAGDTTALHHSRSVVEFIAAPTGGAAASRLPVLNTGAVDADGDAWSDEEEAEPAPRPPPKRRRRGGGIVIRAG